MAGKLDGKTIAFLGATEGPEEVELTEPWKAVEEAGATPRLISTDSGEVQAFNHLDKADTFPVDDVVGSAAPSPYGAPVPPRRRRRPRLPAHEAGGGGVRQVLLRRRQDGGRDLPRTLDAGRGRRAPRP